MKFKDNFVTEDLNRIERLYTRWLVGDSAGVSLADLPDSFANALHGTPDSKRDLFSLAVLSQYQGIMLTSEKTHATSLPLLPRLDLPLLPQPLQYLSRLITRQFKKHRGLWNGSMKEKLFLQFLAYRGYMLPPTEALAILEQFRDKGSIHPAYLPWINWLANEPVFQVVSTPKFPKKATKPTDKNESVALAQELKNLFELKTTKADKTKHFRPKKLASGKLSALRTEQLLTVDLSAFAEVFELSLTQLLQGWDFEAFTSNDNQNLLKNITNTLPDSYLPLVIDRVCEYIIAQENGVYLYYLHELLPRVDMPTRQTIVTRLFCEGNIEYENLATLLNGKPLLLNENEQISQSPYWQKLLQSITESSENLAGNRVSDIEYLGILLPQALAKWVYQTLIEHSLAKTDPVLYGLNLNQQLAKIKED